MTSRGARAASRRRTVRRRRLIALGVLVLAAGAVVAVLGSLGGTTRSDPSKPAVVRLVLGGRTVASARADRLRRPPARSTFLAVLPAERTEHRGAATVRFQLDREAAAAAVAHAARHGGGVVTVSEQPIAARIRVPLIKQVLRDDCEATALSMLMAYSGKPVGQLALQRQVAHSPPLDPTVAADGSEVWGDPEQGFVGRADGGGPGGGYGVYQGPIRALARRKGLTLRDLSGKSPDAVYGALLHGHPVMAWVALSEGPFASWSTLAGKHVTVNYGEHAVVLTGVDETVVHVNDPLSGTRLTWARPEFERMWKALGTRALAA
ncbi:MAG TPA: C39 family peptidase [Solirubrobacterales bacterium]